ncbi:hypothetical protein Tco_1128143, partial [Tanacetum coccineum]
MVKRMASMNTRINIEKLDGNIVQKHGGSKQVGFKQLGPGVETGVHRWLKDSWRTSNLKKRQTRLARGPHNNEEYVRQFAGIQQQNELVDETNVTLFAK